MFKWQCELCSYTYDESEQTTPWQDLDENWFCPACASPKEGFTCTAGRDKTRQTEPPVTPAAIATCNICGYSYDEVREGTAWDSLPADWICPACGAGKASFSRSLPGAVKTQASGQSHTGEYLSEWQRKADEFETHMADIHQMAMTGKSLIEPMRTRLPTITWDEILIKGAQLSRLPLNKAEAVDSTTVIGTKAARPLVIDTPVIVSHMSFGALSPEAKIALAKGSAAAGTATSSGEGGILPESLAVAHRYIFEYVPNKYSVTNAYLQQVDAIEIKIGQSAKPGMGGHLPGVKVTKQIAEVRGFPEGQDIYSPAHFADIRTPAELKKTVDSLRQRSAGRPIGIKLAAGHLRADIEIALSAGIDFITIDGRAGGTGSAAKVVKNAASIPAIFALARARQVLDEMGAKDVSLIITGGLRISSDFAKALAMGADAVAIATTAMMALGCQQYRICDSGKCPVGIATQDPELRARFDIDKSAQRVANFFTAITDELKDFARMTGHGSVHGLCVDDLCTTNSEISNHTSIEHV